MCIRDSHEAVRHPTFRVRRFPPQVFAGRSVAAQVGITPDQLVPLHLEAVFEMQILAVDALRHDDGKAAVGVRTKHVGPQYEPVADGDRDVLLECETVIGQPLASSHPCVKSRCNPID